MTAEAIRDRLVRRLPAHGFRQVVRPDLLVSYGDPQPLDLLVVAHQALIEAALVFQYECQVVSAEGVSNRQVRVPEPSLTVYVLMPSLRSMS